MQSGRHHNSDWGNPALGLLPLEDNWSHNMGMQLGHNVRLLAMYVGARLIAPG